MSRLGRFRVRRLPVIGSAVALGAGVASVGLLSAGVTPAQAAPSCTGTTTVTCTFSTVGTDTFTVPAGVSQVTIDAKGAEGGGGNFAVVGGKGAQVQASFSVTAAEVLNVVVGGGGGSVASGGGGGGGSFVYRSPTATGLLIAAAGGGGARATDAGIPGSATTTASDGESGNGTGGTAGTGGNGGGGGSGVNPGGAGGGGLLTDGGNGSSPPVGTGAIGGKALVFGSAGGSGQDSDLGGGHGGFGGGGGAASGGGGGGGGYNGGGGGGGGLAAGGGGGSFFATSATNTSGTSGANTGNGQVTITYANPTAITLASASAARTEKGVLVRWRTGTEAELLGFHVYRSRGHSWKRLTHSLIVAKVSVSGASYRLLDRTARRGVPYRYRIKAVNRDGTANWFGPVRVT
jgi:hypothetical protein